MKKTLKLAVIGALMAVGLASTHAQTTNTNFVLNVNIALTAYLQVEVDTVEQVRLTTKDVIQALGRAIPATFSTKAKLLVVNTLGVGGGEPRFIVRDEGVDTDVSAFLGIEDGASVEASRTVGGRTKGTQWVILRLIFLGAGEEEFDVRGLFIMTQGSIVQKGVVLEENATTGVKGSVAGSCTLNDSSDTLRDGVCQGKFTASGGKVELDPP